MTHTDPEGHGSVQADTAIGEAAASGQPAVGAEGVGAAAESAATGQPDPVTTEWLASEQPAPAAAQPTPTVGGDDATRSRPAGTAAPSSGAASSDGTSSGPSASSNPFSGTPLAGTPIEPYGDRPEVLAGAAFVGGVLAAFLLKRLGR